MIDLARQIRPQQVFAEQGSHGLRRAGILVVKAVGPGIETEPPMLEGDRVTAEALTRFVEDERHAAAFRVVCHGQARQASPENRKMLGVVCHRHGFSPRTHLGSAQRPRVAHTLAYDKRGDTAAFTRSVAIIG